MKAESRQIPQMLAARLKFVCCQHNTDDGGQAMGEEMRHVQMSR